MVPVNDTAQIVQSIHGAGHKSLPVGAFCQFSVSRHHIDPALFSIPLARQCHAHSHGKSVAQGTGVHFNSRQGVVGMTDIGGVKLGKPRLDILQIQEPFGAQYRIIRLHRMSFA